VTAAPKVDGRLVYLQDGDPHLMGWIDWLARSDPLILQCVCPHAYRGGGVLYGVSEGPHWVRVSTDPACRDHGDWCRCCSGPTDRRWSAAEDQWCSTCASHVTPPGAWPDRLHPWQRTWSAQHGTDCPRALAVRRSR
jgi:hypothetical protein